MRGSVVKRGEKRYSLVYRAPDPLTGKVKQVWQGGFTTKGAAEDALKEIIRTLDGGTYTAPTKQTVTEFVRATWLPSLKTGNLRPSTVAMYRRSIETYALPHLGSLQVRNVKPAHLTGWLAKLKSDGVGDRTVEIAGVTMHKCLKAALDLELISRNPADVSAVRAARPKAKAARRPVWTAAQTNVFFDSQRGDRLEAFWRLAAMTGLRRGELAGLRWAEVDLDAGTLRVRSTRVVIDYAVVESTPKTEQSRRVIGLDPATISGLRAHGKRQKEDRLAWKGAWSDTGLVFTRENGEGYHPQFFTQTLAARARAAGLPPIRLHDLRHGHATAGLEAGVPLTVMSKRLGHASTAITGDLYSHVSVDVDKSAAEQIATAMGLGGEG